jgi:hypothetical protein
MKKKSIVTRKFRYVCRHSAKGRKMWEKQVKKVDVRYFKKRDPAFIDHSTLLPTIEGMVHNIPGSTTGKHKKARILNTIFEDVLLKIMDDMIENKNYYTLPNAVDFIIGTMKTKRANYSFFTFDTRRTVNKSVRDAERNGYMWRVIPNKTIGLKLRDYNDNRKYNYIPCKQLLGRQLSARSRGRLDLLMSKLIKKGLRPSSLELPLDLPPLSG